MGVTAPRLSPQSVRELHDVEHFRHGRRIALFVGLYLLGTVSALSGSGLACVPGWLLAAASLHGISLFTHEAVHGTLAANPFWNRVLGALCAFPVLQNCSAYRVLHLRHHQHLGDDGDPDHYANYTRWPALIFLMNWGRLLIGYPAYITAIPILGYRQGSSRDRAAIVAEVLGLAMLALGVWWVVPHRWLLHGWLMPMLMVNTMVNIRGMSQHTLLPHSDDEVLGTRTILTNRVVRFFMCNENFHLEHHLYPGIPWYHLPQVHDELGPELRRLGAPYIGSYSAFVWEFVRHSRQPLRG